MGHDESLSLTGCEFGWVRSINLLIPQVSGVVLQVQGTKCPLLSKHSSVIFVCLYPTPTVDAVHGCGSGYIIQRLSPHWRRGGVGAALLCLRTFSYGARLNVIAPAFLHGEYD